MQGAVRAPCMVRFGNHRPSQQRLSPHLASGTATQRALSADCLPALPEKIRNPTALRFRLLGVKAVLIGAVRFTFWRSTTGTMEATHGPAGYRWSHASFLSPFRGCRAAWTLLERIARVHGVESVFCPETFPTIACPPSCTVTFSTRIVCSPPRYRLSVSTCAAKVRASLLKARSALSC